MKFKQGTPHNKIKFRRKENTIELGWKLFINIHKQYHKYWTT